MFNRRSYADLYYNIYKLFHNTRFNHLFLLFTRPSISELKS